MSDKLFTTLVNQLASIPFAGRLSYHFYNEPLLRRDLERLVSTVDRRLPEALQVLYTNGDRLDERRYASLRTAGVDFFIVTLHDGRAFPKRDFQYVQRGDDLILTNRGGTLTHLPAVTADILRTPCYAPSDMAIVTVSGDVLLCYEDATRGNVMGNILDTHLIEIWWSPRFVTLREQLARGDRSATSICRTCTNVAHASPGLSLLEEPFAGRHQGGLATVAELKQRSVRARRALVVG